MSLTNRFIIDTDVNVNRTVDISFEYNIYSINDYGIALFFGNNLLDDFKKNEKIKNRTTKEGLGLYGKTKNSQQKSNFSIGIDNKGYFALSYGNYVNGKKELNNYNTITVRAINGTDYYNYIIDEKIIDFSTPPDQYNKLQFRLEENGTRLIVLFRKYDELINKKIFEIKLPGIISSINAKNPKYNIGFAGLFDNDKGIKIRNLFLRG